NHRRQRKQWATVHARFQLDVATTAWIRGGRQRRSRQARAPRRSSCRRKALESRTDPPGVDVGTQTWGRSSNSSNGSSCPNGFVRGSAQSAHREDGSATSRLFLVE